MFFWLCPFMVNLYILFFRHEKQIRYPTRKARADVRKRVKGRFVKKENYDSNFIDVTQSYQLCFHHHHHPHPPPQQPQKKKIRGYQLFTLLYIFNCGPNQCHGTLMFIASIQTIHGTHVYGFNLTNSCNCKYDCTQSLFMFYLQGKA